MVTTHEATTGSQTLDPHELDPRKLLILRDVIHAGSISAGARRLGWTQPAVSRHIHDIERQVRTPVVLRRPGGVTPTEAGKALLAHADAIAAHLQSARTEVAELRTLKQGVVRLACYPSGMATLVPTALAWMARHVPGVEIRLLQVEPDEATALLVDGEVDLALVFDYPETTRAADETGWAGLADHVICDDDVLLVVEKTHPAASADAVSLADVADETWVAGCPRCREHLLACARATGFEPRVSHETDDYVVVQRLVGQGLAVSILPHSALVAYHDPSVTALKVAELTPRRISARFPAGADHVPSVAAVLQALVSAVNRL